MRSQRVIWGGCILYPSSLAGLDDLARPSVVAPQRGPSRSIGFGKVHLKLGTHDLEAGLVRLDRRIQRYLVLISLLIGSWKVEIDGLRREFDLGACRVDLLEVERDDERGGRLIKVVPDMDQLGCCQARLR